MATKKKRTPIKVLLTSDFHLDFITAGVDRYTDVCNSVDETVAAAIKEKVNLYIFLGDLCDPDTVRSNRSIAKAVSVARELEASGIESWWLVGNHDVIEDGSGGHTMLALEAAGFTVLDRPDPRRQ